MKRKRYRNEYMLAYYKKRKKKEPWWGSRICIKSRCANTKKSWYKKGIKCLITVEQLRLLWIRDKASKMTKPSVDRIDNNGDYTFENCRYIEHSENAKIGNIGNKNKLGKYRADVKPSALKMRAWR